MRFYQKWTAEKLQGGTLSESFATQVPGNIQYDYAKSIGKGQLYKGFIIL